MMKIKEISVVLSTIVLSSCATWNVERNIDSINNGIKKAQKEQSELKSIKTDNFITKVDGGLFASNARKLKDTDHLPNIFYDNYKIDMTLSSLKDVSAAIMQLTGIASTVDSGTQKSASADGKGAIRVTQQNGNLVKLLDMIASKYDVAWSYHDGHIEFNQFETRTWPIHTLPGDFTMNSSLNGSVGASGSSSGGGSLSAGGGGGGGGSSGGNSSGSANSSTQSQSTTNFNTNSNVWDNIKSTVQLMLSPDGKIAVSQADATMTVTDRPHVIRLVDRYVQKENKILSRQVQLDVKVYSVKVENSDNYGINWGAVFGSVANNFDIKSIKSTIADAASFTLNLKNGNGSDSASAIQALSKMYKTSVVTTATVITQNNQPAPISSGKQITYLASSQTTQSLGVSQVSLTPGVVNAGFYMSALPNILSNGRVNLQLSINISNLIKLAKITSDGAEIVEGKDGAKGDTKQTAAMIQLPEIEVKSFLQKVILNSGDTLVLSGFERNENELKERGVGSARNWLFGGGLDAKKARDVLVIVITPKIIGSQ